MKCTNENKMYTKLIKSVSNADINGDYHAEMNIKRDRFRVPVDLFN